MSPFWGAGQKEIIAGPNGHWWLTSLVQLEANQATTTKAAVLHVWGGLKGSQWQAHCGFPPHNIL